MGGNEEIGRMLRYMKESREENATDEATKRVHGYTERIKIRPEVRRSYMLWEEYVEEWKEEGREKGREKGREEGLRQAIQDLLERHGNIPGRVIKRLQEENDFQILRSWLKLAASVESMEDFESEITTNA